MNRLFLALDGDNAGQHIGQAVLMDDVQMLHDMSQKIEAGTKAVKEMVLAAGGQIISSGGDEMTAMMDPQQEAQIEQMRAKYQEITGFSASVGLGNTLSQAGKALIAAKLTGKDKVVKYDQSVEEVLNEAHQAAQSGTADEEQQKMDEHYIDPTMDEEMPQDEEMPMEDEMSDEDSEFYEESPEDMMQYPEGVTEESLPQDEAVDQDIIPDGEIPMSDEDMTQDDQAVMDEEMPMEDGSLVDETAADENSEPSDFEQEAPIALEGEENLNENKEDEQEKADSEMMEPEMATEEDNLDADLADADINEEILQRIAANLDAFKQNKELMDQIKEAKPDLYAAMLGLLHNMIELARMISPEAVSPQQEEMIEVPSGSEAQAEEQTQLPKQSG